MHSFLPKLSNVPDLAMKRRDTCRFDLFDTGQGYALPRRKTALWCGENVAKNRLAMVLTWGRSLLMLTSIRHRASRPRRSKAFEQLDRFACYHCWFLRFTTRAGSLILVSLHIVGRTHSPFFPGKQGTITLQRRLSTQRDGRSRQSGQDVPSRCCVTVVHVGRRDT